MIERREERERLFVHSMQFILFANADDHRAILLHMISLNFPFFASYSLHLLRVIEMLNIASLWFIYVYRYIQQPVQESNEFGGKKSSDNLQFVYKNTVSNLYTVSSCLRCCHRRLSFDSFSFRCMLLRVRFAQ